MNLTDFLIELASDPQKAADFKQDPRRVMADAGLSQADQDLLMAGDPQAIRSAVNEDEIGDQIVIVVFISVLMYGDE